jgi:hypothetical protein
MPKGAPEDPLDPRFILELVHAFFESSRADDADTRVSARYAKLEVCLAIPQVWHMVGLRPIALRHGRPG